MLPNIREYAWLYRRGEWLKIRNLIYDEQFMHAAPTRQSWRQILREYRQIWGTLGPAISLTNYSGIHVYVYSYTGDRKAPEFLIRIVSMGNDEIIYAQDLPDLLGVLALLSPLVSSGIFSDAYTQGRRNA
jgi:hypothetical protein